jgi:KDO2-lipid IV(A) lauroyltransferase
MEANPRFRSLPRYELVRPVEGKQDSGSSGGGIAAAILDASGSRRKELLEAFVRETAARVLGMPAAGIDPERPLNECGLDSLMAIELVNRIETGLGLPFPTEKIVGGPSVRTLAQILEQTLPAGSSASEEPVRPVELIHSVSAPVPVPVAAPVEPPPAAAAPAEAPLPDPTPAPTPQPAAEQPEPPVEIGRLHRAAYFAYRLGTAIARAFPLPFVYLLGSWIGGMAFHFLNRRRELAMANLRLALELPQPEAEQVAREHFKRLGANILCMLKLPTMSNAAIRSRVSIDVAPGISRRLSSTDGAVVILSHMGNWELAGRLSQLFPGHRFGAVYQPLANPLIDRHFKASRASSGISLFSRHDGFWKPISFLKSGGVLGVLADQNAGDAGAMLPFFGAPASTSTLAAGLATGAGVALVPVAMKTTGIARWHVSVCEPLEVCGPAADMSASINRELERQIRESPADWLWSHNRWKLRLP